MLNGKIIRWQRQVKLFCALKWPQDILCKASFEGLNWFGFGET